MKCVLLSVNNIDEDYAFNRLKEYIEPNMKVLCIPFASDLNWLIDKEKTELEKYGRFWTSHYKPFSKYGITEDNFYVKYINRSLNTYFQNYQKDYYSVRRGHNNKYSRCKCCGGIIEKTGNKRLYCDDCALIKKKESNRKADKKYKNKMRENRKSVFSL